MLANFFRHKWQMKDPKGYRLIDRNGLFIERTGGKLVNYNPTEFPSLHFEFAKIEDSKAALDFVKKYGFVTCSTEARSESVSAILDKSGKMRDFLRHIGAVHDFLPEVKFMSGKVIKDMSPLAREFNRYGKATITVGLEMQSLTTPVLSLATPTLLDWLFICVAGNIAGIREPRICPVCGATYEVDRTDGRSMRRKFCDRANCRLIASRRKRKRDKKSKMKKPRSK